MKKAALTVLAATLVLSGCALTLRPVDFSWSYESVLTAGPDGVVKGEPKTIAFNARPLFREELGQAGPVEGRTVRIIRNDEGYYFITAPGFKRVYIYRGGEAKLWLTEKVLIDKKGMEKPFFNRRDRGVELVANGKAYLLNKDGIVPEVKK
ncbi:MAG TPA: hypothetical protein VN317_06270 [Candidatus Methanoperedens sp.]|nr:hypothetical protein [Candidatus Methanoperedens sp.]